MMRLMAKREWKRILVTQVGVLAAAYGVVVGLACACPVPPHAAVSVGWWPQWYDEVYVPVGQEVELTAGANPEDFSYDPDDIPPGVDPWPCAGTTYFRYQYRKDGTGDWFLIWEGYPDALPKHTFYEAGSYEIRLTVFDNDGQWAMDICMVYMIRIELTEPSFLPLGSPSDNPPTAHDFSYTCTIVPSTVPASAREWIEVWMDSRSARPGYCCNSTQQVQGYQHDYRFYLGRNPGFGNGGEMTGQKLVKEDPGISETVKLTSRDYGGYGDMKAKVKIKGDWYYARCARDLTRDFVRVPRDDNDNDISDEWAYDSGNGQDDNDNNPGGANNGDGLERYEEYRGFLVQGTHVRTNPNNKDLFIYDEDNLGFGYANDLGFAMHNILSSEWSGTGSRKMNANEDNDQCGIWLYDGGWHDQAYGITSGWGTPNDVTNIRIFTEKIADDAPDETKRIQCQNQVIAHEIGHAVALAPLGSNTQEPDPNDPHHYPYVGCIMDKYIVWATVPKTQYCDDCHDTKRLH